MMSDHILKAFEAAFGVWTTTGYFKHKPTQHQLDGFRKGYAIAEQASADRIAKLEQQSVDNLLLREGGHPHLPESNQLSSNPLQLQSQEQQTESHVELTFRRLLCMVYSGSNAYTDDGELQDNAAQPFIDFKRDSAWELQKKLHARLINSLTKIPPAPEGESK